MPTTPSHNDDDDFDEFYERDSYDDLTPTDALIIAGLLLDSEMLVPVDIIAKCHSAGLYFAH